MPKPETIRRLAPLYKRFSMDRAHAEHVAALCDRVFLELPHLHGLTKTCRRLVEAAALLHDIEEAGGKERHDLLGARRIGRLQIAGLPERWQSVIVQAVRLHSTRSDVPGFLARLEKRGGPELELAARVAAILRIADGLDHCREQDTEIAAVADDGEAVEIFLSPSPHAADNAQFALRKADLWNRVCLRPIGRIAAVEGDVPSAALVQPRQPMREAARRILQRQFEQFVSREYGVTYGEDPEYIHEMRVAMRRFRSALVALRGHVGPAVRQPGKRLSALAEGLGAVRDTDVFLEYLKAYAAGAPRSHRPVLRRILDESGQRRQAEYRHLSSLGGPTYREVTAQLRQALRPRDSRASAGGRGGTLAVRPAWREARRCLRQCLERLLKHGRRLKDLPPRQQHLVRIDCKRLRYLAEFFQGFYGRQFAETIKTAVALQDLLGQVHDSYVYAEWLKEEARPPADRAGKGGAAIAALLDHLRRQRRDSLDRADKRWKSFRGRKAIGRLVGIIKEPRRT